MKRKKKSKIKPEIKKELKNKTILITGGAGSIASHFVKRVLDYPIKAIRVLDIDEHALFVLSRSLNDKRVRLQLGSILDKDRLDMAGNNVDIIIHTAAIKNIEISEYNPIETIETNINGTVNLIKMAIKNKPKIFLNISTDFVTFSAELIIMFRSCREPAKTINLSALNVLRIFFISLLSNFCGSNSSKSTPFGTM